MGAVETFNAEFSALRRRRAFHASPALTKDGLEFGAGIMLARRDASGALDLSDEDHMHVLLAVCCGAPTPEVARTFARADAIYRAGDACLAHIHLAQLGLPLLDEERAFAGFIADRLMAAGLAPAALEKALGVERGECFGKYDPDQPRDERGRWTSDGGAGVERGVGEGRSVSPGGEKDGAEDFEEEKLYEERRALGETTPEEDQRHGKPIDPLGPTPFPFAGPRPAGAGGSPSKTELLGGNPKLGGSRWNTDLPGGRAEAEALFEQLAAGQTILKEIDKQGDIRLFTPDQRIQLRIKANGEARIDRPIDVDGTARETIHFNGR